MRLIWIFYGVLIVTSITSILKSIIEYSEIRQIKLKEWNQAKYFFDENCRDPVKKEQRGTALECREREHFLMRTPSTYAIMSILESYSLCGRYGCEYVLGSIANNLASICIILLLLYILAVSILGCWLKSDGNRREYERLSFLGGYPNNTNNGMGMGMGGGIPMITSGVVVGGEGILNTAMLTGSRKSTLPITGNSSDPNMGYFYPHGGGNSKKSV